MILGSLLRRNEVELTWSLDSKGNMFEKIQKEDGRVLGIIMENQKYKDSLYIKKVSEDIFDIEEVLLGLCMVHEKNSIMFTGAENTYPVYLAKGDLHMISGCYDTEDLGERIGDVFGFIGESVELDIGTDFVRDEKINELLLSLTPKGEFIIYLTTASGNLLVSENIYKALGIEDTGTVIKGCSIKSWFGGGNIESEKDEIELIPDNSLLETYNVKVKYDGYTIDLYDGKLHDTLLAKIVYAKDRRRLIVDFTQGRQRILTTERINECKEFINELTENVYLIADVLEYIYPEHYDYN